jgi:hypothetical protein
LIFLPCEIKRDTGKKQGNAQEHQQTSQNDLILPGEFKGSPFFGTGRIGLFFLGGH